MVLKTLMQIAAGRLTSELLALAVDEAPFI